MVDEDNKLVNKVLGQEWKYKEKECINSKYKYWIYAYIHYSYLPPRPPLIRPPPRPLPGDLPPSKAIV